ncbi:methylglyoxal synthase [Paradevosia shaoguanensis]|jgi:methylglyoxal synthase|uniref:Methylglyoxal synthase n=1 Tax=Paradevosia shaoguanensis TaxID=1335043 RepID=A0AA41QS46_9HYPH|nr:methylglyoxal synthase [Paradevosia shaoguanensis]KFL25402.1 methylglyoxal synthase [Devosia sp. 17-2-E-8]MCF1744864.1 methylglyoxal synthase [Paradevosia shaoguanensis]MCI0129347.1 methylglyoxal synthase [Paradevosia shaoguanensis]QMV00300.1 methylglyoxal synthase [Devosia sp. D6-9]
MARIGLVAHDDKKDELVAWSLANRDVLAGHELWGTGTTGRRVIEGTGLPVTCLKSGPLGGDAQLGAMIAEGRLDVLIFFQDPLTALPHDVDVKALNRLATLYNTLFAINQASADAVLAAL